MRLRLAPTAAPTTRLQLRGAQKADKFLVIHFSTFHIVHVFEFLSNRRFSILDKSSVCPQSRFLRPNDPVVSGLQPPPRGSPPCAPDSAASGTCPSSSWPLGTACTPSAFPPWCHIARIANSQQPEQQQQVHDALVWARGRGGVPCSPWAALATRYPTARGLKSAGCGRRPAVECTNRPGACTRRPGLGTAHSPAERGERAHERSGST